MTDPPTHPPDRLTGALEGRYELQHELGAGGMATVYLARDVRHDRDVAIKVLKPELAAVIGGERFITEIRTTANLQHPHILPLFDSGESDGFLYYVMPFVDGESLRDKLDRERQLGVDESIRIAKAVASALQYAHGQGVIHRDIKPENILLHAGQPVVADFGIALALSAAGGGRMTETGLSLGTPHYMSPEQATADRDLSARSDVYSLACVLYEMLAGDPPHIGPTAQAILMRILTDTPRSVTEVRSAVPPHIASALAKALEKLPADRFETAEAFSKALDDPGFTYATRARAAGAVGATASGIDVQGGKTGRATTAAWLRDPRSIAALAFAGIAALFVVAGAFGGRGADPGTSPALRSFLDLGGLEPDLGFHDIVISPDGSRLAVAAELDGVWGIYQRSAVETDFRLIPGTEGSPDDIAFSPNGEWIAYVDSDLEAIMKVSLLGGAPQPVVPAGSFQPRLLDWGVEGQIVFWGRETAGGGAGVPLYRVSDTGGPVEQLLEEPWDAASPQLLPDGSGVLFSDYQTGSVALYAFDDDSVTVLVPEGRDAAYVESGHILFADEAGGLWAQPFDLAAHALRGDAKPVLQALTMPRGEFAGYSVSRGGTLVYTTGGAGSGPQSLDELVVMGRDGSTTAVDLDPRDMSLPRWSPDGRSVAYAGSAPGAPDDDWTIYTYDVERATAPVPITVEGNNDQPVWSPDGSRIVFSSRRDGTDQRDLFLKSLVDDTPARLLLTLPGQQYPTDWPEEHLITVESGGPSDILLLDLTDFGAADSVSVRPYFSAEADVDALRVSPDGTLAAYHSNKTGRDEIYLRSFPDFRAEIPVTEAGGRAPMWSPSGDTIYYRRLQSDSILFAVIERDPTPTVVSRAPLAAITGTFDLHPDGDRFIMTRPVGTDTADPGAIAPVRHIVVTNWFSELRRIFEGGGE